MGVQRTAASLVVLVALVAAGRAQEESAHEQALKQMIDALGSLGKTLEGVEDEDAAKAARPELKKGAQAFVAARQKSEKLPPPDRAEKDRLAKEYRPRLEEAMKKLFTQVRRVERLPGGPEALVELRPVLRKDEKGEK